MTIDQPEKPDQDAPLEAGSEGQDPAGDAPRSADDDASGLSPDDELASEEEPGAGEPRG